MWSGRGRDPRRHGRRGGHGLARGVEEDRDDVDAADTVDERVVGLGEDREAVVGQALDQQDLPQRLAAIHALAEDPRGQALELLVGPGAGSAAWRMW